MQLILLSQTDSFGVAILSLILVNKCAVKLECVHFLSQEKRNSDIPQIPSHQTQDGTIN